MYREIQTNEVGIITYLKGIDMRTQILPLALLTIAIIFMLAFPMLINGQGEDSEWSPDSSPDLNVNDNSGDTNTNAPSDYITELLHRIEFATGDTAEGLIEELDLFIRDSNDSFNEEYSRARQRLLVLIEHRDIQHPDVEGFTWLRDEIHTCGCCTFKTAVYRNNILAEELGLTSNNNNIVCEFTLIPDGNYQMGASSGYGLRSESPVQPYPRHEVSVSQFLIGKTEVSQLVWDCVNSSYDLDIESECGTTGNQLPIYGVSYRDVVRFLSAINLRLPSEAEWEYACRAGTDTIFFWGNSSSSDQVSSHCWYQENSLSMYWTEPHPETEGIQEIGVKLPNAFGLCDIQGNVSEWVQDSPTERGFYEGTSSDGSAFIDDSCEYRIIRGGNCASPSELLASAYRSQYRYGASGALIGFRLAASIPDQNQ